MLMQKIQPIAKWSFNEGHGNTVRDSIGGITGTISGAKWVSGLAGGYALSFSGNNFVEFPVTVLNGANQASIKLNAKLDDYGERYQAVIARDVTGGVTENDVFCIGVGPSGQFFARAYDNTGKLLYIPALRGPDLNWHELLLVWNGPQKKLSFYIDGEKQGEVYGNSSNLNSSSVPLVIGAYSDTMGGFIGTIDEVELYNLSLR